ncbi:hypothetical protein OCEANICA350_11647 [Oceanicaulis sp. 350]|nr:hypothetical protein OCEANICA350_11647 [Oceanicaulis sp. 350]
MDGRHRFRPGRFETDQGRDGTGGRTRTDKGLRPGDFESPASTNSATPARMSTQAVYMPRNFCLVDPGFQYRHRHEFQPAPPQSCMDGSPPAD